MTRGEREEEEKLTRVGGENDGRRKREKKSRIQYKKPRFKIQYC